MKIIVFINSYYIDVPNSILELDDSFPGRMSITLFPTLQHTWNTSRKRYLNSYKVGNAYETNDYANNLSLKRLCF